MTYSVKDIFLEIIKEDVQPFMKQNGFKKQNLNFLKAVNGFTFIVQFQSSGYNSDDFASYYVNCGIYAYVLEHKIGENPINQPKEINCHFRERMERITKNVEKSIEIIESSDLGKQSISKKLLEQLMIVISFFDEIKNMDDFIDICIERGTLEYEKVFKFLCLENDVVRLSSYFQNFGTTFKDDERFLFFENRLNNILIQNGQKAMKFTAKMLIPEQLQRKVQ
jgi:Domain of unknown function (DUF4304)